jgi:hypothetical protein
VRSELQDLDKYGPGRYDHSLRVVLFRLATCPFCAISPIATEGHIVVVPKEHHALPMAAQRVFPCDSRLWLSIARREPR